MSENSEAAAGCRRNSQAGRPRYRWLAATAENSQTRSKSLGDLAASHGMKLATLDRRLQHRAAEIMV